MFSGLEQTLVSLTHTLSIEMFVFVASIVEEIIAPIPSPTVMVISGSLAKIQGYSLYAIVPLALIGAVGKTFGALVVYTIADKAEDVIMRKFGKFFNVTHEEVKAFGERLGKGLKDYAMLTFLRALPFMPSVVVSVGSGLLKVPLPVFIVSTFLGTIFRDGFYLYAGYVGAQALLAIINKSSNLELYLEVFIGLTAFVFIGRRLAKKYLKGA